MQMVLNIKQSNKMDEYLVSVYPMSICIDRYSRRNVCQQRQPITLKNNVEEVCYCACFKDV